jgi:hypothetical protein
MFLLTRVVIARVFRSALALGSCGIMLHASRFASWGSSSAVTSLGNASFGLGLLRAALTNGLPSFAPGLATAAGAFVACLLSNHRTGGRVWSALAESTRTLCLKKERKKGKSLHKIGPKRTYFVHF